METTAKIIEIIAKMITGNYSDILTKTSEIIVGITANIMKIMTKITENTAKSTEAIATNPDNI